MPRARSSAGYFRSGLPYNRFGRGPRVAVIFQDLQFEHKPLSRAAAAGMTRMYRFLNEAYTIYLVGRKPCLPEGYSLREMADDYATMVSEEFPAPVDVIGRSTGGSIAQYFAADHPQLVRRLVLHSSAYTLSEAAKQAQRNVACLARQRAWRDAYAELLRLIVPPNRWFTDAGVWLGALVLSRTAPADPSDLIVTIAAEDSHDFRTRLAEISAPTLVIGGKEDLAYGEALFRETAEGIPKAQLILYDGMGHAVAGKKFACDVLSFLLTDTPIG